MKTLLIVNPVSGKGLIKNYLLSIVEALGRGGSPNGHRKDRRRD